MKLEKTLSVSEEHIYTINLENAMSILTEINQIGIDLVIDIYNPNGTLLNQIDSPNGENSVTKEPSTRLLYKRQPFIKKYYCFSISD